MLFPTAIVLAVLSITPALAILNVGSDAPSLVARDESQHGILEARGETYGPNLDKMEKRDLANEESFVELVTRSPEPKSLPEPLHVPIKEENMERGSSQGNLHHKRGHNEAHNGAMKKFVGGLFHHILKRDGQGAVVAAPLKARSTKEAELEVRDTTEPELEARDVEDFVELEARDIEEIEARDDEESLELEARDIDDPELEARDFDELEFEARDIDELEELEARDFDREEL
ncbi:hypothetical protein CPB86DRAFT_782956 [Serendipita vermifera]|nr:hypothetical protein CPB86DRAFT_782956 [Serendipita vermifera]